MKAIDSYGVDRGKVEVRNTRRGSLQEKNVGRDKEVLAKELNRER